MKKVDFVEFLLSANRAGFADPDVKILDQPDGAHKIVINKEKWLFIDYWFGGNPFSGQESVTYDGKAIWAMQYRGGIPTVYADRENEIFAFLKQALLQCSADEPIRGPREYVDGDWQYVNTWNDDLAEFVGHEEILFSGEVVHTTDYFGGLVDGAKWEDV